MWLRVELTPARRGLYCMVSHPYIRYLLQESPVYMQHCLARGGGAAASYSLDLRLYALGAATRRPVTCDPLTPR